MLRAIGAIIVLTCLSSQTNAEEITWSFSSWFAPIVTPNKPISKPPQTMPVQLKKEPTCDFGVGPCGGTCNEEHRKPWTCKPTELPCYKEGGRCKCEQASLCQPKIQ
jgi:hypothetical protein